MRRPPWFVPAINAAWFPAGFFMLFTAHNLMGRVAAAVVIVAACVQLRLMFRAYATARRTVITSHAPQTTEANRPSVPAQSAPDDDGNGPR